MQFLGESCLFKRLSDEHLLLFGVLPADHMQWIANHAFLGENDQNDQSFTSLGNIFMLSNYNFEPI